MLVFIIILSITSATSLSASSYRCEYKSIVIPMLVCPNLSEIILGYTPNFTNNDACECLKSWNLTIGNLFFSNLLLLFVLGSKFSFSCSKNNFCYIY